MKRALAAGAVALVLAGCSGSDGKSQELTDAQWDQVVAKWWADGTQEEQTSICTAYRSDPIPVVALMNDGLLQEGVSEADVIASTAASYRLFDRVC